MKCPWMYHWVILWRFLCIFILDGNSRHLSIPRMLTRGTKERPHHNPIQACTIWQCTEHVMWFSIGAHWPKVTHLNGLSDWFGYPHLPFLWSGPHPADAPCNAALPLFPLRGTFLFSLRHLSLGCPMISLCSVQVHSSASHSTPLAQPRLGPHQLLPRELRQKQESYEVWSKYMSSDTLSLTRRKKIFT